ncbi:MAG TPA: oligoendopeptidase F [Eubacterium sp.]|nr:oligoendopeptidase F [Eubacterium sp.]
MQGELKKRSEIDDEFKWKLEDIFADRDEFLKAVEEAKALTREFVACKDEMIKSASALKAALDSYEAINIKLENVYSYANMSYDQDTGENSSQELYQIAQSLYSMILSETAFFSPLILSMKDGLLEKYYEEEEGLLKYRCFLTELLRTKEHTLSPQEEQMLAEASQMGNAIANSYKMLLNADIKFPDIETKEGTVTLSNGRYIPLMQSDDRELRKKVFETYYDAYKDHVNTFASLYDGQLKRLAFFAKMRKYESSFVASVDSNAVDPKVCLNLIEAVHDNMDKMYAYVAKRKAIMGYDKLHMYDIYVPIVSDVEWKIDYKEACDMTLKALKVLGDEYIGIVTKAFDERWIDVYENENKRSGAYSSGAYGVHPYMLLNHNDTLDDVFTLVHEMGHSIHTWYSTHNQTYFDADYKIFVAEVASTTNELLLLMYLLNHTDDEDKKRYLKNHYLDNFKSTLYRQTMFAEFELKTADMLKDGVPVTAKNLCDLYAELNSLYYGPDMEHDDHIAYEWCRIPHFYYNYYVYQYATSFAASVDIAKRIYDGEAGMVDKYLSFLKSGCTSDPVSLLKIAGVDLSTKEPVCRALEVFGKLVEEF